MQEETVLKGAVRAERLEAPQDFIPEILSRVQRKYVERHYSIKSWTDVTDFLTQLAYLMGKLVKGGEPDLNNVSIQVINDFQRVSDDEREREGVREERSDRFRLTVLLGEVALLHCTTSSQWRSSRCPSYDRRRC